MGDHEAHGDQGSHGLSPDPDQDASARLEAGRLLFARESRFMRGAAAIGDLPESAVPEVCFAGRSNVGKSSLLNALTGRRQLARTSNTPGRTQEINFFDLDGRLTLVDLPGYGYARASKTAVKSWTNLVRDYLRGRPVLRRALILVDARHGLKDSDLSVMDMLDKAAVNYQVVLTKADKVPAPEMARLEADIGAVLAKRTAAHPVLIATSSIEGTGVENLRAALSELALPVQPE